MLRPPELVRDILTRRYRSQRRRWLAGEGNWPLAIGLGCPTEQQAQSLLADVPAWVNAWRGWTGPGEVIWCERRWRSLGAQRLPDRLVIESAGDVAIVAGEECSWRRASSHYAHLVARWPALAVRLPRWFDALAEFDARDIQTVEALLAWLELNPDSQLFPRQLPIPGMDTKWIEARLPMAADLLQAISGRDRGVSTASEACGLREPSQTVRLRILDAALSQSAGGMQDLSAPIDELCALRIPVERVYIVENIQTGLAFGPRRGAVVVMGLGYGVSALARVPWIAGAECIYWGDIDTHGFAILNRARSAFPEIRSLLMDETTLLRYRELWVTEKEQCPLDDLPLLNEAEGSVYRGLKEQRWGLNLRLEQERISWGDAMARAQFLHFPTGIT